jgi:tetratricopeptide (TPR) repeat protein
MIDGGDSNDTSWLYKAEEELRRALEDDPGSARVHSGLASVYLHQGRKELVPIEVEKALKAKPDDPEALTWLVEYHRLNGEDPAAATLAKRMIEREPLFFPPRMTLGEILRTQGDTADAIREQGKILEQAPENLYGVWYLSRAYLDAREMVKARGILERGRTFAPKNHLVHLGWALLLALEGKREEALKAMDEEALDWLDRAVRNGDDRADWFRRDPLLANIHRQARFGQIVDSISYRRKQGLRQ